MGDNHDAERNVPQTGLETALPQDGVRWWKKRHLVSLNFKIVSLIMLSYAGGYDGSLMNGLQALPQWNDFMGQPTGAWLGFINAIYWLFMGVSFPISTIVSNRWGRKPGIYVGYVMIIVGAALQTACKTEAQFIIARAFVGAASAWWGNNVPILINEIAYPTHRSIASALYNCGFYVGAIISAWVTFAYRNSTGSWGWRLPSLLQILLPIVAFPGLWLCSDSPRFLVGQDRIEDARKIICETHAGGDDSSPLVNFEIIEMETTIRKEKEAHDSSSYADMLKTPANRHRLFISISLGIFSQWSGNGVVSYYLALVLNTVGVTSPTHQLLISAFLQVWNLIFAVAAAVSVERLGRRPLFLASAVVMFVSYVIITALSGSFAETGSGPTGTAVIPFLFIFFAGYDIALTPLLAAYPVEVWQFSLRSRGLTVTWVATILAIFFNTFINPIALEAIGWKYYIVFVVILILYFVTAYFAYPETKGHTLEEMAVLFEGKRALETRQEVGKLALAVNHVEEAQEAGDLAQATQKETSA